MYPKLRCEINGENLDESCQDAGIIADLFSIHLNSDLADQLFQPAYYYLE